jgi:hypothetical protein
MSYAPTDTISWAKRKLGYPTIQVELTNDQWNDAASDALLLYNRYKPSTVLGVTRVQQSNKKYALPTGITGIIDFCPEPNIPQFSQIEFSILYRSPQTYLYDVQDLAWWQSHLRMVSRIFGFQPEFRFENLPDVNGNPQPYIFISSIPQGINSVSWLGTQAQTWQNLPAFDLDLMRKLTLAYAKGTLGMIRRKYGGVPSPESNGMIQLDGERLTEESEKEIAELQEFIMNQDRLMVPGWG